MVALLQNTQTRSDQALQHKLNALADGLADLMAYLEADGTGRDLQQDLVELMEWMEADQVLMFATDYPHYDFDDPAWGSRSHVYFANGLKFSPPQDSRKGRFSFGLHHLSRVHIFSGKPTSCFLPNPGR